ncbi:MAG TPA: DUF4112 domain-containing protein [Blastocatellia bacterium]|nr:DUF4112 domain-containing protein [Blastocatellia bacterium]
MVSGWREDANGFIDVTGGPIYPTPGVYDDERSPARRAPGVTLEREVVLLTRFMDTLFRVPVLGWRFGLNTILDFVPGIGDTVTSIICLYILICAVRYRVPKTTILRMALNIAIYYVGGLTPFAGDLFDTWWKPNRRNLRLLARYGTVSPSEHRKAKRSDIIFVGALAILLIGLLAGSLAIGYLLLHALLASVSFSY